MNITHDNYEEYFILYVDNELSAGDRRRVEAFIQQYPELKGELTTLLQSKLLPDSQLIFEDKEDLLKIAHPEKIHTGNFEERLILYLDNELTTKDRTAFESFIEQHPALNKELEIFSRVKLEPDVNMVFPDKQSLYKKTEKSPVITIRWWRIAAAVILLAAGVAAFVLMNNKQAADTGPGNEMARQEPTPVKENPVTEIAEKNERPVQENLPPLKNNSTPAGNQQATVKNTKPPVKKEIPAPASEHNNTLALNQPKPSNNLPAPENNPYITGTLSEPTADIQKEKNLTPQNSIDNPVTTPVTNPYITYASHNVNNTDEAALTEEPNQDKSRLRGFFRKVTRVFEKRTNIKATDNNDQLHIAGFTLKLK